MFLSLLQVHFYKSWFLHFWKRELFNMQTSGPSTKYFDSLGMGLFLTSFGGDSN